MESLGRRFWEASLPGAATSRRRYVFPTKLLGIPWTAGEPCHCWDLLAHLVRYRPHLWQIRNQIFRLPCGRDWSTQAASQVPAFVLHAQLGKGLVLSSELLQIYPCHREFRIGKIQGKKEAAKIYASSCSMTGKSFNKSSNGAKRQRLNHGSPQPASVS